jgi:hypothetical protein
MSEFSKQVEQFEHEKRLPRGEIRAKVEAKSEKLPDVAAEAAKARQNVAESAVSANASQEAMQALAAEAEQPQVAMPSTINRELKAISRRRELKQIRRKETPAQRGLSHVIHQPFILAVSEGAGKTISRPSGLLGGGLVAFLGSGSYLVLAKYLGFTYNYTVSLALFVGGFLFGLLLEVFVHLATASRRQLD